MPTEVFDDTQDFVIDLLEAEIPSSSSDSGYPQPLLSLTGRQESRTFRTLILENEHLRVTVLPDLGGRISSLFDKRTNTEIIPSSSTLRPVKGGPRGVTLPFGIQLRLQGSERLNALGSMTFAAEPAQDEQSPASVWLGEAVTGTGLSFHSHLVLAADRAEMEWELKIFNRTLQPVLYNPQVVFHVGAGEAHSQNGGFTYYSAASDAGFYVEPLDGSFERGTLLDGDFILSRFAQRRTLAPRQLDTIRFRVVPFARLGTLTGANREAGASIRESGLAIQSSTVRLGHKLLLLTASGQTLEAPVDLYPERILEIPSEDLPEPTEALVLQDSSKREILRVALTARGIPVGDKLPTASDMGVHEGPTTTSDTRTLRDFAFDIAHRHLAHTLLGYQALARKEYAEAEQCFEQALLFNAEDHLLWWAKAMAARLREGPGEERAELLNAHFLAPLEPVLRAEGFLTQSQEIGKEPSPLLAPMADHPESFVDVAALLVEMGLNDQATRWIDEALRHTDLVMLHYLQAFCFIRASRMHVEAAEHLAAASRIGFSAPYPWRAVEWEAIQNLRTRFPNDELLQRYGNLNPATRSPAEQC